MHLRGYVWRPVTDLSRDPVLDVVDGVVLHVDAANAKSLYNWFDGPSGGIESTAFLPKSAENDKEQYRDTTREADAQNLGNSWVKDGKRHGLLSLETQGYGSGEWTPYQLDGIKDFILQAHKEHKFPLQVMSGYHGRGVGYHSMFKEWNPNGHSCPGPARILQFQNIIVPWLKEQSVKVYTWQQGDTIPMICKKFDLTVLELWRLNPGAKVPFLRGDKVRIR